MLDAAWLDVVYLGNTVRAWTVFAAIATAVFLVTEVLKAVVVRRLSSTAKRTATLVDDTALELLRAFRVWTAAVVSLYLGTRALSLPARADDLLRTVLTVVIAFQAVVWANTVVDRWLVARSSRAGAADGSGIGYGALRFVARTAVWAAVALVALDNLGVEITTLVAGLGVGGIAVALAVQSILGDVFCSLSIMLDKPFELGDFIVVGELAGTVENIGVKTTRLRSLGGEQLVFSNSDLVGSRVRNYKRMWQRRILFEFGVTYQTPADVASRIPGTVRRIIESMDDTRFDRAHFKAFGDSSLVFEVVYFVLKPDYGVYMDKQEAINLTLMREFEKEGIEFAYPTRTLYLKSDEDDSVA